jgi:salicylate hydroxylase
MRIILLCLSGGLGAAVSMRRAGHRVTIYERADYAGEVGASISCAVNGTRFLEEWGVDASKGKLVILRKLIQRDWKTGEVLNVYDLADYKDKWGFVSSLVNLKRYGTDGFRFTTCFTELTCMPC